MLIKERLIKIVSAFIFGVAVLFTFLPTAFAGTPVKGGSVVYLSSKIPSLNPLHSAYEVGLVTSQIFASPVRMDENNEIAPYLAESWTISPDGKTYTFNLAKNAKFHDGSPVTSEDLAFSIDVVLKNHRFGKQMFGPITGYEFPDKNTLVVNLSKAHGPLLLAATTPRQLPVMPKHVYGNSDDFMKQEAHSNPVGSGPFVISDRKTDEYVSIARNENHFVDGLPYLDSITYLNVGDKTAKRIGLRKNQFQLARTDSVMRFSDIKEFSKIDHLELAPYEGIAGGAIVLEFNNRTEKLSNKKVRQAIAYAVDRSKLSNVLHSGYTIPSRSPMPATNVFFNDKLQGYPLDLDKANSLLDEAGYPKGSDGIRFELNLIFIAQPFMPDFNTMPAEFVAASLKKVGIKVKLEPLQGFAGWAERSAAWDFDMSINWPGDKTDPAIGVSRLYVCDNIKNQAYTNTSGYCNAEVDKIFAAAAEEANMEKRTELYYEVQDILLEEMPMLWMFDTPSLFLRHKDLFFPAYGTAENWDVMYWTKEQN
ncbi:MAG: ABC transporter substrate-binding protein [Paracoccaceae bacterium]|jgi:peptide/nickel transport system substrate-binding protein|nr:ABC transporter substrate-binding protein [Paracoccaceae bacterium]